MSPTCAFKVDRSPTFNKCFMSVHWHTWWVHQPDISSTTSMHIYWRHPKKKKFLFFFLRFYWRIGKRKYSKTVLVREAPNQTRSTGNHYSTASQSRMTESHHSHGTSYILQPKELIDTPRIVRILNLLLLRYMGYMHLIWYVKDKLGANSRTILIGGQVLQVKISTTNKGCNWNRLEQGWFRPEWMLVAVFFIFWFFFIHIL